MAVLDDIKSSKGYILGVIAFATAVATFLTTAMGFRKEPTITAVAGLAVFVLYLSWLIDRSEKRQIKRLKEHNKETNARMASYDKTLECLTGIAKETQLSTLRIEMDNEMARNPANHDTILRYAEKYFIELGGDWVHTDKFYAWVESEKEAGRPVRVPPILLEKVNMAKAKE